MLFAVMNAGEKRLNAKLLRVPEHAKIA